MKTARELRERLDQAHPNPARRRRVRRVLVLLLLLVPALLLLRRSDPAAAIDAQYADVEELLARVPQDQWDDAARRDFREALAAVDRAIEQARDAVRRCPENDAIRELCHLAHRARRRLVELHLNGG